MRTLATTALLSALLFADSALAGGVGLSSTRMVYSGAVKQTSIGIRNTDKNAPFLIQSWIEDASGQRSNDFVVTPPLFILKPTSENSVKVMFSGKALPTDRETLYWMTVKAIPQSGNNTGNNTLQFASASRIKLFYRPAGVASGADNAWDKITGEISAGKITLINPTPYYITIIDIKVDGNKLKPVMIPPLNKVTLAESLATAKNFTYRTVNDYGAWTKEVTRSLNKK